MITKSWRVALVGLIALAPFSAPRAASADQPHPPDKSLSPTTRFLVPPPDPGSLQQVIDLFRHQQVHDAALIAKMVTTPQAVWSEWFSEQALQLAQLANPPLFAH